MIRLTQNQRQMQVQKISPSIVLAQKILQLTSMQIEQGIYQELEQNPALEIAEEKICSKCGMKLENCICESMDTEEIDISDRLLNVSSGVINEINDDGDDDTQLLNPQESFQDFLLESFKTLKCPSRYYSVAEYIISLIDENGFLNIDSAEYEEIAQRLEVDSYEIDDVIKKIQLLDPPGIATKNVREALLKQIDELDKIGKTDHLAREIISYHWEDFISDNITKIAKELKLSEEDIKRSFLFVRNNLNPYPIRALYIQKSDSMNNSYIKPDVIFKVKDNEVLIDFLDDIGINIRVNPTYLELYENIKKNIGKFSTDEIYHVKEYIARAKAFIKCIHSRRETLWNIFKSIASSQGEFIKYGPAKVKPLTRKDIAKKLSICESTISRALSNRYCQLPSGEIVNFDVFFDNSTSPKESIKDIINNENKKSPLSDEDIAKVMKNKGFNLARRTIAKYREELEISSSKHRRKK